MNRWTKWTAVLLGLLVLSLITAVFSLTVGEMPIRLGAVSYTHLTLPTNREE